MHNQKTAAATVKEGEGVKEVRVTFPARQRDTVHLNFP